MRNNISKNQSFLFSEVGCLKSNQSGALCSPFPFSKLLWEISWFSWPSQKPFSFRSQWFQSSEFCPQSTGSLLAIQICHWIANPSNRQFVVSRFPRVVRSQKITVPAKSTDFSNCFCLNPQLRNDDGWTLVRNCISKRSIATIYNDHGPIHLRLVVRWIKWRAPKNI